MVVCLICNGKGVILTSEGKELRGFIVNHITIRTKTDHNGEESLELS